MCERHKITSIQVQAKRRDRFSVFLDGEFAFGIHQDVLLKSGIAQGDELDSGQIEKILSLEERRAAKEKAMRLLAVRPRSNKEIADRLHQAKFPDKVIDWVIPELERVGLLNDLEFAKMFARSRMITKPVGEFLLRRELAQKGLSEEQIEAGVEEAYAETDELKVARNIATRRKKRYSALDEVKAKKRLSDFLIRRGFSWEIVKDIIGNWENL